MWGLQRSISAFASLKVKKKKKGNCSSFTFHLNSISLCEGKSLPEDQTGSRHSGGFSRARAFSAPDLSRPGVAVTGWHTLSAVAFKPLSPLRKQSQPGSRWPSGEVGRACIQSVLTELALRQLLESQLLSLNGQFYCILMEDVIIGWARLTENTFLSFLLLSLLSANCK